MADTKYKWSCPNVWLIQKIYRLEHAGETAEMSKMFRDLVRLQDHDTIQDLFQNQMDADGYFTTIEGQKHKCDNCYKIWGDDGIDIVVDMELRVDAGCEVPSGQCPDCGCLCYLVKEEDNVNSN
jgi:hypothetical protein